MQHHRESGASAPPKGDGSKPTIQAASTVVKMPRADQDKTVTSMVPASLRVRRDSGPALKSRKPPNLSAAPSAAPQIGAASDFGLVPSAAPALPSSASALVQRRPAAVGGRGGFDKKYEDFMSEMEGLGALEA